MLNPDIRITVGGVAKLGNRGYAHPYVIRDMCTEEEWEELLARPRIVCEYDYEDEE